jgi:hypothetical protein
MLLTKPVLVVLTTKDGKPFPPTTAHRGQKTYRYDGKRFQPPVRVHHCRSAPHTSGCHRGSPTMMAVGN